MVPGEQVIQPTGRCDRMEAPAQRVSPDNIRQCAAKRAAIAILLCLVLGGQDPGVGRMTMTLTCRSLGQSGLVDKKDGQIQGQLQLTRSPHATQEALHEQREGGERTT